ncbi:MAG TPA: putative zinc-binding peptidase [Polyangiaceae bacterium]
MRPFECACGARVFFENVSCLACSNELGYAPEYSAMAALSPSESGNYRIHLSSEFEYRKCQNYLTYNACNWLVRADSPNELCRSCGLNRIVPDLSNADTRVNWVRIEAAKRRLIYTIDQLGLPLTCESSDGPMSLAFEIKADTDGSLVLTGHDHGVVTLKLEEADPVTLEQTRIAMRERYRSMLGHLRHESGHFYFEVLLANKPCLKQFRQLFGDEQEDYGQALQRYYAAGHQAAVPPDFVSEYATAHPWEDWAETWAHYLHMVDVIETASTFGAIANVTDTFSSMMERWIDLTVILNALNRSMGLKDAYPFQLADGVQRKLEFVHGVVRTFAASQRHLTD